MSLVMSGGKETHADIGDLGVISFLLIGIVLDILSKSFRTGRVERELQMVQISATRRSCISIL